MSQGLFIDRTEFEVLMKEITFIKEYIVAQSLLNANGNLKNKWVSGKVAMDLLGVKKDKFLELRNNGSIVWRFKGNNRGVEVLLKSIEDHKNGTSTSIQLRTKN